MKKEAFAFRFHHSDVTLPAQIWSVGWEVQSSSLYSWNGVERKDQGKCIFQLTLSGHGMIEIGQKRFKVLPGQAFLVKSPSAYQYYFPEDSEHWEFLYLTLYGEACDLCFDQFIDQGKQVMRFHPNSKPIRLLKKIYDEASERRITNPFEGSSLAYQFVMELYSYLPKLEGQMEKWPEPIVQAALFASHHFHEEIGPDDMAAAARLSKSHFTREFKKATGFTPIHYLTNIRLEKAETLLKTTKYSIEEIATQCGYRNANYLNKVFRKKIGMSPKQLRETSDA
ncbi:AraC family transcriptional regulator [Bacillus altitudinis]|uniref:AraC family transcriptional regulator n=2 Tax=Bacillus TaxID=1386 RepID=A0A653XND3_BACAB|nr:MULTISPECIES: AraC family transcriptional regulator [Bacillus]AHL73269.1 AraC family transcriptional regulator [Bacillus pumilus]MCA0923815.1 AraC family transcriptional regulator [Bacillus stratosphericus]UJM27497.1 AraC family transcriptional regulator [Bacillus aerophilus]AMB91461.1 AraC family transcriptional regulator [Bacillus altitudinis]AMM90784.1 AraC family transcriptional regulator [Bacillus pumilus]